MTENTAIQKMSEYLHADIVKQRFQEVVGGGAGAYIASVVTAVANSDDLQKCRPESVYTSALRAATLRLSVDPATGQAYLVPFGGMATLIVGYKGLLDMAVRTGKYRYINVSPIYEGEIVDEDKITGWHSITTGQKIDKKKIIGWLGAFEMNPEKGHVRGYAKTLYMTVEEIHEHAKEYSKSYTNPKSGWVKETPKMERKTVLRLLLRRWGYLDPVDVKTLEQIEQEPDAIDSTAYDIPQEILERGKQSDEEILKELGFTPDPKKEKDPNERPLSPEVLREALVNKAKDIRNKIADGKMRGCTEVNRKILAATLGKIFPDNTTRYEFTEWATGKASTKESPGEYVLALLAWMEVVNFEDEPTEMAKREAIPAHASALREKGQLDLGLEE